MATFWGYKTIRHVRTSCFAITFGELFYAKVVPVLKIISAFHPLHPLYPLFNEVAVEVSQNSP